VLLTFLWAVAGAAMSVRVFQSWWTHPVLVFNPATDGVVPDDFFDSELGAMVAEIAVAVPLAVLWLALSACGFGFLRRSSAGARWLSTWARATAAAAMTIVLFLAVFWNPAPLSGPGEVFARPTWSLLGFTAAFLVLGAGMVTIITFAARRPPPTATITT